MVKRTKRRVEENFEVDGGEFSTVFGDFMSFCMFLFLMLYMMINAGGGGDSERVQDTMKEISKSLKNEQTIEQISQHVDTKVEQQKLKELQKIQLLNEINEYVEKENLEGLVEVEDTPTKIIITLSQPILFNSGRAEIKSTAKNILDKLGAVIKSVDNNIIIEGHTDNIPIRTRKYESNWVLSFYRAFNVMKFIVHRSSLSPKRFSVLGYGENRQKVINDTNANRGKNRRIEISILFDGEVPSQNIKQ